MRYDPAKIITILLFIPIIVGIARFKKLTPSARIVLFYIIISNCCNIAMIYLASKRVNNLFLMHGYSIVEFCCWSAFFITVFRQPKLSRWLIGIAAVFVIFVFFSSTYLQSIKTFNTYGRAVEMILLLAYSFLFFDREIARKEPVPWKKNANHWFTIGMTIYLSGAFLLYISLNILATSMNREVFSIAWKMNYLWLLTSHGFYLVGFLKCNT